LVLAGCRLLNPEAVREHARRARMPVDRIVEVSLEISPAMFRQIPP
jgi:hypothetical protein